jgi:hypothetical protein
LFETGELSAWVRIVRLPDVCSIAFRCRVASVLESPG